MKKTFLTFALFFMVSPALAEKDCTCSHKGAKVPEGQTACIRTSSGSQMAQCSRVLNNTSWKFLGTPCPTANMQTDQNQSKFDFENAVLELEKLG